MNGFNPDHALVDKGAWETTQKLLRRRLTDTPRDIPHVPGNCGLLLNSPVGRDSVAGLSTLDNNPDAALTLEGGQNLRVSDNYVYVLNQRGKPLMPCKPQKARGLLRQNKAVVVNCTPFTIQLVYATGEAKQHISLGVDSGYKSIGISAITDKAEVYASEINLRTDMVKLNSERRQYRRARRHRKTWYRQPRFLNRKKPEGWLAPSIQHKLDSHIKVINQIKGILPVSQIIVEVAAFDIQKIQNPEIAGTDYQNGPKKDFWNVREYVLYRDNHTCKHCKSRSKNPILEIHHIVSRQIGGDRPDNLLTLCSACHEKVSKGRIALTVKPSTGFKAETFMSSIRWKLVNQLRKSGSQVLHTYGYITKSKRIEAGLPKSHVNDAFVIAGGTTQQRTSDHYFVRQVRKCNRKLFRGDRSHIKNTAPRLIKSFQRYDKVLWKGIECFIFGRRTSGYFDLGELDGTKVCASAKSSDLVLLQCSNTLLTQRRRELLLPVAETIGYPKPGIS